jgi:hypothetical protein
VRPEYPRPQFARGEWRSLNGLWQFSLDDKGGSGNLPGRILVPFTFESALSGIGKGGEVHERVRYRRTFDVPAGWRGRRVRLNFGAVDWEARVSVNDREVGSHRGGYTPFSFDITDALKDGGAGPQVIEVAVYDPADPSKTGWQPKGKQLGSEGIWYTRTTGIWQSVWLEPVAPVHLAHLDLAPSFADGGKAGVLRVSADLDHTATTPERGPDATVELEVMRGGKRVAAGTLLLPGGGGRTPNPTLVRPFVEMRVADVAPWSPESPTIYDVRATLKVGGAVADTVTTYTAFRTAGIADGRLTLNGKTYFYRGVLDQGFWPDGIYTPPTDAAIRADVEAVKRLGFNMARKHVKVEDPRWYYWCDRLGVAVWQDMPSSHDLSTPEARENFTREWRDLVATVRDYPCVVHWIPFNENWGNPQAFQDEIVTLTRSLDPARPITDASGWTQRGLTDVIDAHDYSNNLLKQGVASPVKPKVVGEYGGIALPITGHTWTTGWGYQNVRTPDALIRKVRSQTAQLFEAANLSGFVYTQLTDVEQEMNGLLTYDRLPKAPDARVAAVFTGRDRAVEATPGVIRDWLVLGPLPSPVSIPSAQDSAANRAAMADLLAKTALPNEALLAPAEGQKVEFAGKTLAWRRVRLGALADEVDLNKVFGGENANAGAYAVAYLDSPKEVNDATLLLGTDDGVVVYLNGERVWSVDRIRGVAADEDTVKNVRLKKGRNVLLVKVGQGVGGWGLTARVEPAEAAGDAARAGVAHRVLGQDRGRVAVVSPAGTVEWEAPCPGVAHDISLLPGGNVLTQTAADNVVEFDRAGKVVWQYQAKPKPGNNDRVEIHAFQRLAGGVTMVAESGNRRIVEVDRSGNVLHEVPLTVENPNPHRDTRLVRKLESGNYLACHEADATVREYDPAGKVVWSYKLDLNGQERTPGHDGHGTEVFGALRRKNGNTLIAGGNNNRVIEVDPSGKVVWSVERDELPGIRLFWVTTLQELPNGNLIIGNTHAGAGNPQLIEVTRDKRVVWSFRDFDHFGNDLAAAQVIDVNGIRR